MSDPILFVRPDPTTFALLVTKTGRGTATVVGTEHLKPSGTEWATLEDLWDAGYVRRDAVAKFSNNIKTDLDSALRAIESGVSAKVALERVHRQAETLVELVLSARTEK